ncbi:cutinase [Mycolicibacterium setense]|uniref:cutinase family protein n=1 Tax=Mycolicibacterium setense TaxID=431269 RepID=UPI0007EACA10|nr:cutinase family protein [Mycolicibacterium setense]OBB11979.1 cutinase [Mycolicibacterium setense]
MTSKPALILVFAALAAAVPTITPAPATAAPCPDVEVVFARGTNEPPGLGSVGGPFVDDLRARVAPRTVDAAAVDYPANNDFHNSTPAGTDAARSLIESVAASCPNTKMVLGGYSQGAAVIEQATTAASPQTAEHVAATALFGTPRTSFSGLLASGMPLPTLAPQYAANSIDQCNEADPICWEGSWDMGAHVSYVQSGKVVQAADFVAGRL